MSEEIFLPAPGFEKRYMVSNMGRVKSLDRHHGYGPRRSRIIALGYTGSGYPKVTTCIDGAIKHPMVHRLVAMAFIPNPDGKRCVNHKNGIKTDNRVENLEWMTHSENSFHALRTGLRSNQDGSNNHMAKLTHDSVIEIRALAAAGVVQTKIAARFGITQTTVSSIHRGSTWVRVPTEVSPKPPTTKPLPAQ